MSASSTSPVSVASLNCVHHDDRSGVRAATSTTRAASAWRHASGATTADAGGEVLIAQPAIAAASSGIMAGRIAFTVSLMPSSSVTSRYERRP